MLISKAEVHREGFLSSFIGGETGEARWGDPRLSPILCKAFLKENDRGR